MAQHGALGRIGSWARDECREMLRQGAIEFLACAAIFLLLALLTTVMFLM